MAYSILEDIFSELKDKEEDKLEALGFKVLIESSHSYTVQTKKNSFDVYMSESIGSQYRYEDLFCFLRTRTKKDKVNLYINNYGGSIHTLLQLLNCVKDCKGEITGICDSAVYSAAPILLLSCPKIILKDNSMLMFHDYSGAAYGKGNEQKAQVENVSRHIKQAIKGVCHPFLSMKEIDSIVDGKDMYVHRTEAVKRLRVHLKKRK